ncbi:MAG: AI-2E family transporter [Lachnospiraceae bacterium]|nr:AI-2E family transporter [Lachnospiraceae bacterium]MCI9657506.1 AI-2E family transporter [Lachnospiraceae bacterium]
MKEKKELIQYTLTGLLLLYLLCHYWDFAIKLLGIGLGVIRPLILGGIMAYLLNLILSFYERTFLSKWRTRPAVKRGISILLSFLTLLLIFSLIINMIVPELKSCIDLLLSKIPIVYDMILQFFDKNPDFLAFLPDASKLHIDVQTLLQHFFAWMGSGAGASLFGYLSSVVSMIFNLFVSLVFALYLLAGKEWLGQQTDRLLRAYLPAVFREKLLYVLATLNNCFRRFIVGQCMEAVILGILCILGMFLFRFPYAVMIGILVGATALIPVLGAYIGAIVGILMIFTESPIQALFFLLFIIVLQQLENQLIYPRVVGTSIGLPGILVFSAVMVGGGLFGVAGILLGIPLTAACYQFLKDDLKKRKG